MNLIRYFIELAYNGSAFHGWQIQPNAFSVQEAVEDAITKLLHRPTQAIGAGRTDTGVHASYFVAHFETPDRIENHDQFVYKINRILPHEIAVFSLQQVDSDLHSRFSALSRTYQYHIHLQKDPFRTDWSYKPVFLPDFDRMNEAAALLGQFTDFTSFSKLHTDVKTNNCAIQEAFWKETEAGIWVFTITADRFLRNMVRAIVGTLLEAGKQKITTAQFCEIIQSKDRSKAGTSAPAHALFLTHIAYPENKGFNPTR